MIKLGQKVRDKITGFEGIVIGITKWINGCTTVGIKAKMKEDGTVDDAQWTDEPQVEVVKENKSQNQELTEIVEHVAGGRDRLDHLRSQIVMYKNSQ